MSAGAFPVHLVSDSTGETVSAAFRAASGLFRELETRPRLHAFVRTEEALAAVLAEIGAAPGPVFCTLADRSHARRLGEAAAALGLDCVDVLGPLLAALARRSGQRPEERPGGRHRVDRDYLDRMAALDFAMSHDDGLGAERLLRAEVILTGVSRTSKTPTCFHLACQGVRAANVPLVPGEPPPPGLLAAHAAGVPVVGLTASPQRLAQIRRHRLAALGGSAAADYVDPARIRDEVTEARLLFGRLGIPVIDVTRRSIEETAAAVRLLLRGREHRP